MNTNVVGLLDGNKYGINTVTKQLSQMGYLCYNKKAFEHKALTHCQLDHVEEEEGKGVQKCQTKQF